MDAAAVETYLTSLQTRICSALEAIDGSATLRRSRGIAPRGVEASAESWQRAT